MKKVFIVELEVRVHEHPLPVGGDHVHVQRFASHVQRLVRVQFVGGLPDDHRQHRDDDQRPAPDHDLHLGGVRPVRRVFRLGVAGAESPGEHKGQHDGRYHHDQHQADADQDQVALGEPDHALRIQQHPVTARQAEAGQGDQRQADAVPADIHWRSPLLKKRA
ncbi:hypothetical protein G6F59_012888 [Rhizopus arrhizus]|nr:hypothetical protein G6F59_012888 [Rhizopus arrhizus]